MRKSGAHRSHGAASIRILGTIGSPSDPTGGFSDGSLSDPTDGVRRIITVFCRIRQPSRTTDSPHTNCYQKIPSLATQSFDPRGSRHEPARQSFWVADTSKTAQPSPRLAILVEGPGRRSVSCCPSRGNRIVRFFPLSSFFASPLTTLLWFFGDGTGISASSTRCRRLFCSRRSTLGPCGSREQVRAVVGETGHLA